MRRIERGELRADRVRACPRLGAESSTLDAPDRRGTLAAHRTFPLARRPVRRRAHGTVDIPFPPRVPHRAALGMPVWSRVRSHSAALHRIALHAAARTGRRSSQSTQTGRRPALLFRTSRIRVRTLCTTRCFRSLPVHTSVRLPAPPRHRSSYFLARTRTVFARLFSPFAFRPLTVPFLASLSR